MRRHEAYASLPSIDSLFVIFFVISLSLFLLYIYIYVGDATVMAGLSHQGVKKDDKSREATLEQKPRVLTGGFQRSTRQPYAICR